MEYLLALWEHAVIEERECHLVSWSAIKSYSFCLPLVIQDATVLRQIVQ